MGTENKIKEGGMKTNWQHVFPLNEEEQHDLNGFSCDCEPKIDWDNELVVHNSYDGRESVEQAKEILATNSINLN